MRPYRPGDRCIWMGKEGKPEVCCLGVKGISEQDVNAFRRRMVELREPGNDRGHGQAEAKDSFEKMIFQHVLNTYPGHSSEKPNAYTSWNPLKLEIARGKEIQLCPLCYIDAVDIKMETLHRYAKCAHMLTHEHTQHTHSQHNKHTHVETHTRYFMYTHIHAWNSMQKKVKQLKLHGDVTQNALGAARVQVNTARTDTRKFASLDQARVYMSINNKEQLSWSREDLQLLCFADDDAMGLAAFHWASRELPLIADCSPTDETMQISGGLSKKDVYAAFVSLQLEQGVNFYAYSTFSAMLKKVFPYVSFRKYKDVNSKCRQCTTLQAYAQGACTAAERHHLRLCRIHHMLLVRQQRSIFQVHT